MYHNGCFIPEAGERVIEIHSKPDREGRQSFTMYWVGFNPSTNQNGVRAQEFNAVVSQHYRRGDKIIDRTING